MQSNKIKILDSKYFGMVIRSSFFKSNASSSMKDTARSASMLQEMGFDRASFLLTQHTLIKGRKKWRPKRCNTLEWITKILPKM